VRRVTGSCELNELTTGVRSELDMTIENGRAMVSGEPRQREIVAILASGR